MFDFSDVFLRGALVLILGLIIGFQRERKETSTAGIRTFPILSLVGFFCALLEPENSSWMTAAGFIGIAFLLGRTAKVASGLTTEVSALLLYLVGAYLAKGTQVNLAIVTVGVCALLLHLKEDIHSWVDRLNIKEVKAIMQFVLIALVILPLLPDKTFDTYNVINPQQIWLMVVLITGISLGSFSVQKIMGPRSGLFLSGIFGGLISSTAATVTLSRLSTRISDPKILLPSIIIASTAAFIRILVEVFLVAPSAFRTILAPISILFIFMLAQSIVSSLLTKHDESSHQQLESENPSQLKAAIVFGLLYAVILYVSAWARANFGNEGLYVVSFISGLIDVDAITITTSRLMQDGMIGSELGWRSIMIAFLSNLTFKAGLVFMFAKSYLKIQIGIYFGMAIAVGLLLLTFWH